MFMGFHILSEVLFKSDNLAFEVGSLVDLLLLVVSLFHLLLVFILKVLLVEKVEDVFFEYFVFIL